MCDIRQYLKVAVQSVAGLSCHWWDSGR